jgi:hypothetical protein
MRTSLDIPDDVYRQLKIRAAENGETLRDLILRFVEGGLRGVQQSELRRGRRDAPPVLIPARGIPILALTANEVRDEEENEDRDKYAGSS